MNLWILTEERPKSVIIEAIVQKFSKAKKISYFSDSIRILPVLNKSKKFKFKYEVVGFSLGNVEKIFLKIVSGKSSFVDFVVFYQYHEPNQSDTPLFAIEETKTSDQESRNTGIYQRATKFVYVEFFYPGIKKIMLYNFPDLTQKSRTQTNIFGSRCLRTLGVEISGRPLSHSTDQPWHSVKELIDYKSSMSQPPSPSNVPINIELVGNKITISGKLIKSGRLGHDPNVGALSLISATLRKLGWKGDIEITHHGLSQKNITSRNKFVFIAQKLGFTLEGLTLPGDQSHRNYWYYEDKGEKLSTIFIHIVVENFTTGISIYENHAGCERGYFLTPEGDQIQIPKRVDSNLKFLQKVVSNPLYRDISEPTSRKIELPDLVLLDIDETQIINIEGKQFDKVQKGISQLHTLDAIENYFIKEHYPNYDIVRTVVLYGGTAEHIDQCQVSFLLNKEGKLILGILAPKIFKKAIENLRSYWNI